MNINIIKILFLSFLIIGCSYIQAERSITEHSLYKQMYEAIKYNDLETVKKLFKEGFPTKYINKYDSTPLHWAAEIGKDKMVEYLIKQGLDINALNFGEKTPLHLAARGGHTDAVKILIANGADINAQGGVSSSSGKKYKNTPLHNAISTGNIELVKLLVEKGAKINIGNYENNTPLHRAVINGNKDIVLFLIQQGADLNIKDIYNGYTALHYSAGFRKKEITRLLICYGANIEIKDKKGNTPLNYAIDLAQSEKIIHILKQASNPEIQKLIKSRQYDLALKTLKKLEKENPIEEILKIREHKMWIKPPK